MRHLDRKQFLARLGALGLTAPLAHSATGNGLLHSDNRDLSDPDNRDVGNPETSERGRDYQPDSLTCIYNGRVITPWRTLRDGAVIIRGNRIEEVREGKPELTDATEIDAGGRYISPGFIDLHVHGGGDADFLDGDVGAFLQAARTHAIHGTTAMFPTALSGDVEVLMRNLEIYERAAERNREGATFMGVFLEGPYYSMDQRGAQDPRYIRDPDPAEYREILSQTDVIKRWDSAPERDGAAEFARYLVSQGILPSIGHTSAVYEEVVEAFENGYRLMTHLYSSMLGVTRRNLYRYAGAVESAYLIDEMSVEVIADGKHLPASLLKLIYKNKGPDRIALVTDAMRGAGMPEGPSVLGPRETGLDVVIEDGVAMLTDRSSFAGSVATTDRLVRTMRDLAEVPLDRAVQMASHTPAAIMGIDGFKGSLTAGKDADIVLFDEEIRVDLTMVEGRVIHNRL